MWENRVLSMSEVVDQQPHPSIHACIHTNIHTEIVTYMRLLHNGPRNSAPPPSTIAKYAFPRSLGTTDATSPPTVEKKSREKEDWMVVTAGRDATYGYTQNKLSSHCTDAPFTGMHACIVHLFVLQLSAQGPIRAHVRGRCYLRCDGFSTCLRVDERARGRENRRESEKSVNGLSS